MSEKLKAVGTFPVAGNDFYKTNGGVYVVHTPGPSLTRQEFLEESDINSIMKRYEGHATGANGLPRDPNVQPMYVDFTTAPSSLLDYMTLMQDAEVAFMTLPAGVRREFENNAHAFVDFASDPENLEQMRTWGLAPPAKTSGAPGDAAVAAAPGAVASASPPGSPVALPAAPGPSQGPSTHGST